MGESIWIILTISMTILAAGLAAYLAYYKKNIQSINNELEMILREDTNYLLTSSSNAAELKQHVLILNESLSSIKEVKKKMVRTNKSFRESIAGVSHDLRTPLTSAGGYIQMLQNEKLDLEQRKEYTKIVRDRIQTVGELLDQLFAYARMEADELELDLEPVNLSNILFDTLSLYYKDFTARNEEPEITVPDRVCFIKGHFDSVKRVITNIIYNALIHGDGNYKFQLKEEAQTIVLLCSNKTNSIRQEDVEYLFDRFYTTDKSRNRKTTGLGLAVAKRLTELMGGTIGAELIGEELCIHVIFIKQ